MLIANKPIKKDMNLSFLCNPVIEMISSLHVLSDPSHHPECIEWAKRINNKISPELKESIEFFSNNYNQWILIMDVVCYVSTETRLSAQSIISKIGNLSDIDFAFWFLSGFIPREKIKYFFSTKTFPTQLDMKDIKFYLSEQSIYYFLDNPGKIKAKLVLTLSDYWEKIFKSEWNSFSLYEYDNVQNQKYLYKSLGWLKYVESCHDDIDISKNIITLNKQTKIKIPINKISKIIIIPSIFTSPHLMMSHHGDTLTIYKNIKFINSMQINTIPEETDRFLKALNGSVRLKLLKSLSESPKTTKQLSEIFKLTPSTISGHLSVMKDANLVTSKRDIHNVFYYFNYQIYHDNISYLYKYFEH